MNIRVLLCTAGIAAVQVLSAIELTADSNRLEAGEGNDFSLKGMDFL